MRNKRGNILRIAAILLAFIIVSTSVHTKSALAQGTIYIRPDGSVDPPTAPIRRFGDLYTFTADIYESVGVQRDGVTIDGNGCKLQGAGAGNGFDLWGRIGVTVKNTFITGFQRGIYAHDNSYFNTIIDNTIINNTNAIVFEGLIGPSAIISNTISDNKDYSIYLHDAYGIDILGNTITHNAGGIRAIFTTGNFLGNAFTGNLGPVISFQSLSLNLTGNIIADNSAGVGGWEGYDLYESNIKGNIIRNNPYGLDIQMPMFNNIQSNTVVNNGKGISLWGPTVYANNVVSNDIIANTVGFQIDGQGGNTIYHNNFVDNIQQAFDPYVPFEVQVWDDGYPSGGNYWSNYTGSDYFSGPNQDQPGSDGIGDTSHIINAWETWINKDNYPLMSPTDPLPYVLTISHTEGGITDPISGTYTYSVGATAAVTAVPEIDSVFDHWEIDNVNVGSPNPLSVTMDTNHALHAVFKAKPVIAISTSTGGTTDPPSGSHVYDFGAVVTVSALPESDYLFDHWMFDGVNIGSVNPVSLTMDTNHILQAIFRLMPDIAVTAVTPYPTNVRRGEPIYVYVDVENQYGSTETFAVVVYADKDRKIIGDEIIVGTQTVYNLAPGTRVTLNFVWDTSAVQSGSGYYISGKAIVTYDRDLSDNSLTAKKKVVVRS
jgi:parallel beta-helix repeat protein